MRRKSPLPLAQWLSSRNPSLRAKAETVLYHLGPDAGTALYDAAERELKCAESFQALWVLALILLAQSFLRLTDGRRDILLLVCGAGACFAFITTVTGVFVARRRLRILARYLAKRDDLRSIGPLIDVWRPSKRGGDKEVENELLRLLPRFMNQHTLDLRTDKKNTLRRKLIQIFDVSSVLQRPQDWSNTRADLIVTICQLLARFGGERDKAVLKRIAESRARFPNQQFVREAAQMLLETPFVPPPAVPKIAAPTTPHTSLNNPPPSTITVRRP